MISNTAATRWGSLALGSKRSRASSMHCSLLNAGLVGSAAHRLRAVIGSLRAHVFLLWATLSRDIGISHLIQTKSKIYCQVIRLCRAVSRSIGLSIKLRTADPPLCISMCSGRTQQQQADYHSFCPTLDFVGHCESPSEKETSHLQVLLNIEIRQARAAAPRVAGPHSL